MDIDDLEPRPAKKASLAAEDLSLYSLEDLEARIAELKAEIQRCEEMIASKQGSRQAAESVFK